MEVAVHHQHLFDAMFMQLGFDFLEPRAFLNGDQLFLRRHDRGNRITDVRRKAQVAPGDNTHQLLARHHREPREAQLASLAQQFADLGFGGHGRRIVDNGRFVALDLAHLCSLLLDIHVLVNDADATFLRHGDGQAGFGDGIHCRRNKGNVQLDFAGQAGLEADILRQDLGISRDQENIIESQGFLADTQHGGGSQAGKRKRGIIPTHTITLNAVVRPIARNPLRPAPQMTDRSRLYIHYRNRESQACSELVKKWLAEYCLSPTVENKAEIGEAAGWDEQKAVYVVLMSAFRTGEGIGLRGHPLIETFKQCFADFAATLRASRLLGEVTGWGIDAAFGNHLQAIDRLAERQAIRVQHDAACARSDRISHTANATTAGGGQRLDDTSLGEPAQDHPRLGFMAGKC